jgi:hypothetical protein
MSLDIASKPNGSQFDEEMRRGVTMSKWATIADLMLFDRSSLAEAQSGEETHRILLSERTRAVGGGWRDGIDRVDQHWQRT